MDLTEKIILRKGILVVFEGIDGTGKSTQLSLLETALKERGLPVVTTREPTNGKYGRMIRELYVKRDNVTKKEELELFIQDRKEHVKNFLSPSLSEKMIVLCDRYFLSTIAYQGAAGIDIEEVKEKNSFAPVPDICFLFQLSTQESVERITLGRGESLNDFEQEESLAKVAKIFDSLTFPYIRKIKAEQSINELHKHILEQVEEYIETNLE